MAYRNKQLEQEQLDNADGGDIYKVSGPVMEQSATPSGGQVVQQAPERKTQSGTFQNVMGFLEKNRDQALGLGDRTGQYIEGQVKEGKDALTSGQQGFAGDVSKGINRYDQSVVDATIADPTKADDRIRNMLVGSYKGPTDIRETQYYDPIAREATDVANIDENSKTSGGKRQIITDAYGGGQGASAYDSFLLSRTEPAWNRVMQALGSIEPYKEQVESTIGSANESAAAGAQQSKDTATKARGELTTARDAIRDEVDASVKTKIANDRQLQEAVRNAIATNNFDGLEAAGLTADEVKSLKTELKRAQLFDETVNENNFINTTDPAAIYNPSNVATKDQATRWSTLNQILDDTGSYLDPNALGNAQQSTAFDQAGLKKAYDEQVVQGLLSDEAQRLVARGVYKDYNTAMAEAQKALNKAKLESAASGAATGSSFGPWGAAIGAIAGYLMSEGGWDDFTHSSGFTGPNMDTAWKEGNYARLGSNPAAAIASALGVDSDSTLGKILDPFPSLFGGGDTQGTKDYKAYKDVPDEVPGRDIPQGTLNNITFNVWKENRGDANLQKLAKGFGVGGDFKNKGQNSAFSEALRQSISSELASWQAEGILPTDPRELAQWSGDRIFNKIIGPMWDAKYGTSLTTDKGLIGKMMRDWTDTILATGLSKPAGQSGQAMPSLSGGIGGAVAKAKGLVQKV